MKRLTEQVYERPSGRSRVMIEQDGENLSLAYEGLPGWDMVVTILLSAVGEAHRQTIQAERQRHDTLVQVPQILLPGTGEKH